MSIDGGRYITSFLRKTREVCENEARQELRLRGHKVDNFDCLEVAKGKTGALFAFLGEVCGRSDSKLRNALEDAGYRVGAAYQLLDDLVDAVGSQDTAGKTVGADLRREKSTLAQGESDGPELTFRLVQELFDGMMDRLRPWPLCQQGLGSYVTDVLQPVFSRQLPGLDFNVAIGAYI